MVGQSFNNRSYLFQKRLPAFLFCLIDILGEMFIGKIINKNKVFDKTRVKKILISRPDHLGDVLMTTSILPVIKKAFPETEIHMLIGSWAKEIIVDNKLISKYIVFDHFYLDREKKSPWKKYLKCFFQMFIIIKILRTEKFDLGIELRPFLGNTIFLMWLGGVKYRVGYATAGLGFLLHKVGKFSFSMHSIENMTELLKDINIRVEKQKVKMQIEPPEIIKEKTKKKLLASGVDSRVRLVIFHPGSGRREALWETQKWAELGDFLQEKYHVKVIVTGSKTEAKIADEMINQMKTNPINNTNAISIKEFISLIEFSSLVVGLESFSSHASAAIGVPVVVIHNGIQTFDFWKPWGRGVISATKKVDCAPCWRNKGCAEMKCIKGVQVNDIIELAEKILL